MTEVFVPIAFFATVYGIFHLFVRRKERIALIEKEQSARIFEYNTNSQPSLKYGLMLIGISLGFVSGALFDYYTHVTQQVAYLGSIALFAGIGLITHYLIVQRQQHKQK